MSEEKKFPQRFREAMEKQNLRQVDLVKLTGIGKSAISQYLKGVMIPKQDKLRVLAQALDVNPEWLLGFDIETMILTSFNRMWDELEEEIKHKSKHQAIYGFVSHEDLKQYILEKRKDIFDFYRDNMLRVSMVYGMNAQTEPTEKNHFIHAIKAVSNGARQGGDGIVYEALEKTLNRLMELNRITPSLEYEQAIKKVKRIINTEYHDEKKKRIQFIDKVIEDKPLRITYERINTTPPKTDEVQS